MDVDKVPVLGKINRTMNVLMINFILLAVVCIILGIVIPFFPKVLDLLVAALLIVTAVILLNIAWNIHSYKKKYMKWFK
jgi:cytochrome b subunit of formate dehydrogenase